MVPKKLIDMIRNNSAKLGNEWAKNVTSSEHMKIYKRFSHEELSKRNKRFFENLAFWLEEGASHHDITLYFARVGKERYNEGIPLEEINFGIIIAKNLLRDHIISEGFFTNQIALYQTLEIITVVHNFFDFGFFYIGKEYMEEVETQLKKTLKGQDTNRILPSSHHITDKEMEKIFGIKFTMK